MNDVDTGEPGLLGLPYTGEMTIRPCSAGLYSARNQVRRITRDLGFAKNESADVLLAVGEALSNAYRYGSPEREHCYIRLAWCFSGDALTVAVRDEGVSSTPFQTSSAADGGTLGSGYGLRLMSQAVDDVSIEFDGGTKVVLTKRLVSSARSAGEPALLQASVAPISLR